MCADQQIATDKDGASSFSRVQQISINSDKCYSPKPIAGSQGYPLIQPITPLSQCFQAFYCMFTCPTTTMLCLQSVSLFWGTKSSTVQFGCRWYRPATATLKSVPIAKMAKTRYVFTDGVLTYGVRVPVHNILAPHKPCFRSHHSFSNLLCIITYAQWYQAGACICYKASTAIVVLQHADFVKPLLLRLILVCTQIMYASLFLHKPHSG